MALIGEGMKLEVEVDLSALEKAIRVVPKQLKNELGDAFDHIGKSFLKNFRLQRLQGPPGVYGDGRSGLFGTFKMGMLFGQTPLDMGVHIFSESGIAQRLEYGGTVVAHGGSLTVPIKGISATRAEMYSAKGKLKRKYKNPREIRKTFTVKTKKGKTLIAKKIAGRVLFLYVLKPQVSNDPMLEFYGTWDELQNRRIELINEAVEKALKI